MNHTGINMNNGCLNLLALIVPDRTCKMDARNVHLRTLAMGSAGVAVIGSLGPLSINPASLFYQTDTQLMINAVASNTFIPYERQQQQVLPSWQTPSVEARFLFSSRYLSLSIELENELIHRRVSPTNDSVAFVANNYSNLQLNIAYGNENVALGLFARGGTHTERPISLDVNFPVTDYIQQVFFERYYPIPENQFFNAGAGLLLSYEWVALGLATESLFRMDYNSNQLILDAGSVIDDLTVGLAFTSPKYDRFDELNLMVFTAAIDLSSVGNPIRRRLHFGVEMNIQLSPQYSIALQGGYSEVRSSLGSLFSLNGNSGVTTFGISGTIDKFEINTLLEVPISSYDGVWQADEALSFRIGMMWIP